MWWPKSVATPKRDQKQSEKEPSAAPPWTVMDYNGSSRKSPLKHTPLAYWD